MLGARAGNAGRARDWPWRRPGHRFGCGGGGGGASSRRRRLPALLLFRGLLLRLARAAARAGRHGSSRAASGFHGAPGSDRAAGGGVRGRARACARRAAAVLGVVVAVGLAYFKCDLEGRRRPRRPALPAAASSSSTAPRRRRRRPPPPGTLLPPPRDGPGSGTRSENRSAETRSGTRCAAASAAPATASGATPAARRRGASGVYAFVCCRRRAALGHSAWRRRAISSSVSAGAVCCLSRPPNTRLFKSIGPTACFGFKPRGALAVGAFGGATCRKNGGGRKGGREDVRWYRLAPSVHLAPRLALRVQAKT